MRRYRPSRSAALLVLVASAGTLGQEADSEPFTIDAEWGTFTLDPAIQERVAQKVANGEPLDIPVFIWITGDEFFVPVRQGIGRRGRGVQHLKPAARACRGRPGPDDLGHRVIPIAPA